MDLKQVRFYLGGAKVDYTVNKGHVTMSYTTIGPSTSATLKAPTGTFVPGKEIDISQCTLYIPAATADDSSENPEEVCKLDGVNAALGKLTHDHGSMVWDGPAMELLRLDSVKGKVSGKADKCFTYGERDSSQRNIPA